MGELNTSSVLIVGVMALILLQISWFIYRQIEFHLWNIPPGPIGVPLLGYGPFISSRPHRDFAYLNKTYGKLCSMSIGNKRFVISSDYDTVKELLCHPAALSKPEHLSEFAPGKGGFFGMSGKKWSLERRLAVRALRSAGLGKELWDDIIRDGIYVLMDGIIDANGKPMNMQCLYQAILRSVFCLTMGKRHAEDLIHGDFESCCEAIELSKMYLKDFICLLFPSFQRFRERYNINGFAKVKELMDKQEETLRQIVIEHLESGNEGSTNFIEQYTKELKKQEGYETLDGASVECLVGNIAAFAVATDTVSIATEWIFVLMASYPQVQAKVQAEIDDAVGKNKVIQWQDRHKLPYTMACILEMERWASVIPVPAPRCASETFNFHGYTILKDTFILSNLWAINHDPNYWDSPDKYQPERFLDSQVDNISTLRGYAPFSFGKRMCPAERISLMITFLFLTSIMQKFEVRTPAGEPPDDHQPSKYTGTLEPADLTLCFTKRK